MSNVTPSCPVEATTYSYYPNLAGNSILLSIFALCTLSQLLLGLRFRIIAFSTVVFLGSLAECIGYGGRLIMHNNPWSDTGFKIQIVPIGGGVASAGEGETVNVGNDIMIAGIAFQVATMALCLLLALDFAFTLWRTQTLRSNHLGQYISTSMKAFRVYLICFCLAFLTIFIRCIYRLPEMAGGWGNPLMRNEKEFLILDGAMIAIATVLMTVAHPGIFFPAMRNKANKKEEREVKDVELSSPESMSERHLRG
ncbi:Efflux pump himE [Pseudocercospora fuligena]|uniref:Efflux pump himE n=1 Tax=Pseudocercospora fuligena TaxID=685502 RepID=A0A8H6VHM8_9PEZI|nr:Efflux pump himE [Pseudocercospora fuligena]